MEWWLAVFSVFVPLQGASTIFLLAPRRTSRPNSLLCNVLCIPCSHSQTVGLPIPDVLLER